MKTWTTLIALMLFSAAALAQPKPPGGPEGGGPPGRGQRPPGGPDGPGGGRGMPGREDGMGGGPGMGGPMGGGMGGQMDPRMAKFEMLRSYFEVVERYARLARDPSMAGIASVVEAADILRPRGADTAIAYFEKVLPEAKSQPVQRAIRLQLIELYKSAGKQDQALEQLKTLMTAEPGANDMQPPTPPPPGNR